MRPILCHVLQCRGRLHRMYPCPDQTPRGLTVEIITNLRVVLPPSYQSLLVKGTTGFYHEWVLFSLPFTLAISLSDPDGSNGCRSGPGGPVVPLITNLSAMPKKEKAMLVAQRQSGEPFSSVSHTMTAHLLYGHRWWAPMAMLISSRSSSFVCTSFIGASFFP
jgi:hypothetical protein